jgi:hypothetical protein
MDYLTTTALIVGVVGAGRVHPVRGAHPFGAAMLSMRKTGLASPAYADRFDCFVYDDGRPIGRICEDRHALPELRWYWSLTLLGAGHAGIQHNGREPTLEQAKAQLQTSFKKWLVWAKLEETES